MHSVTILMIFICVIIAIFISSCESEEVVVLRAGRGLDARIPCGPEDPVLNLSAKYVVWLKDDDYVYRFPPLEAEIRIGSVDQVLGPSCSTGFCPLNSGLVIKGASDRNAGLYCCRVHYRTRPSAEYFYNITIVEPTMLPRVYNENGEPIVLGFVGPYGLGSYVNLRCVVEPVGNSATQVYWLRNGEMLKSAPVVRSGVIELDIHLYNITRAEQNVRYECVTQNTDISELLRTVVVIKMYMAPLSVEIRLNERFEVELDQPRFVDCIVVGCQPPPIIRWYLENRELRPFSNSVGPRPKQKNQGNYTMSTLLLKITHDNHGRQLFCKVTNSQIPGRIFEDKVTLIVGHKPICTSATQNIGAVYGEPENVTCIVDSNPEPQKFLWTFPSSRTVTSTFAPQTVEKIKGFRDRYKASLTWTFRRGEFGMVTCQAANMWGEQTHGCIFNVSIGGTPEPPNCDMRRIYPESLRVRCIKGWDGGRPQIIHLEIVNEENGSCIKNLTDKDGLFFLPEFEVKNNLTAVVYASNNRGKSVEKTTYLRPLLVEAEASVFPVSWLPYIQSVGTIVALASAAGILTFVVKVLIARRLVLMERNPDNIVQISDGAFHREPDFIRDERTLGSTHITVNQSASCQNQYSPAPQLLQPACRVLLDHTTVSMPESSSLYSYYV